MQRFGLLTFFLFAVTCVAVGQTPEVREIKIVSSWGGLGTPGTSELVITATKKGYRANGDSVDPARVEKLIAALYARPIPEVDATDLGITQQWLDQNADAAAEEYSSGYLARAEPNQRELFYSSFRDLKFIKGVLPSVFRGGWTDDYPNLEVDVTEMNGTGFVVRSRSQPIYMIPLEIEKNGSTTRTFNSHVARAIADLVPKKFSNRDRLAGTDFRGRLAEAVIGKIEPEWERLHAVNIVGPDLAELTKTFSVKSVEINAYHGIDHGKEWKKGEKTESNLYLVLKNEAMPECLAIRLIEPVVDGKVQNVDAFSSTIGSYQTRVLSIEWLRKLATSGRFPIWLRFVKDASMSEKAVETFTEDMRLLGKTELVSEVAQHRREIALISVGGGLDYYQSYWLVMPDRRVILWRYGYNFGLGFALNDFASKTCPTYHSGTVQCVGAVISPDGEVVSGKTK